MTYIPPITPDKVIVKPSANYNAVKIKINDPQTNIAEDYKSSPDDSGIYNAVNVEVNRPRVNAGLKVPPRRPIYNYPQAPGAVTFDTLPIAYQTNLINNRTLINAEFEFEGIEKEDTKEEKNTVKEGVEEEKSSIVPQPNLTTTETEKKTEISITEKAKAGDKEISFHGTSDTKPVEIVPEVEIKPEVDIPQVVKNLNSENYDIQAKQMEEIARLSMENPQNAVPYIVKEVFIGLINVVKKDTSDLTPPSTEQINTRKKIIINEIIKEQTRINHQNPDKIELPYSLTEEEIKAATALTDLEQAERNKEYALYTMAILSRVYTDEVHKHTGNIVPMTDLPGVSTVVDSLRYNQNAGVKVAAIDSLRYINRPEYKEELQSIFTIAAKDENPFVAENAMVALASLEKSN